MPGAHRGGVSSVGQAMGVARTLVGVGLLLAPRTPVRIAGGDELTPTAVLLMRTIGIRDLALGSGLLRAARRGDDVSVREWTRTGLVSDGLDVVVSLVSLRSLGRRDATAAAGLALVFAVGDLVALGRRGTDPSGTDPPRTDPPGADPPSTAPATG